MEVMRPARDKPTRGGRLSAEFAAACGVTIDPALLDHFLSAPTFDEALRRYNPIRAEVRAQLAAQATGATTDPAVVHDATAEVIPFWVTDPRGLG